MTARNNTTRHRFGGAPRPPAQLRSLPAAAAATAVVLALTACSFERTAEFEDAGATDAETARVPEEPEADPTDEAAEDAGAADLLIAEVDDPVTFPECEAAEEAEDATVTWLEDIVYEEETIAEPVPGQVVSIDGEDVEFPGAPGIVIPERVGQAGCVIEYDAPGACLPAVEISGSYIPGVRVPGRELPAMDLPDGSRLDAMSQGELVREAVQAEGAQAEELCQAEEDAAYGEVVSAVSRAAISRSAISYSATSNSAQSVGPTFTDDGILQGHRLHGYGLPGMGVPGVGVPGESLQSYVMEGTEGTDRADDEATVYYTTEGDVLFDSDEHELRSDAEAELRAIADDIAERDDDYLVTVEGHTDNLPSQEYADNDELSELRAESVANWLVDNAGVDASAISAAGLGEHHPRADNGSDAGRQQNRRVVITVRPAEHEAGGD